MALHLGDDRQAPARDLAGLHLTRAIARCVRRVGPDLVATRCPRCGRRCGRPELGDELGRWVARALFNARSHGHDVRRRETAGVVTK